jgi:hypothetical protein
MTTRGWLFGTLMCTALAAPQPLTAMQSLVGLVPSYPAADTPLHRARLPFGPGEELRFSVRSSRLGEIGEAVMKVTGPDTVRGIEAVVLAFDFSAKVLFFKASDRTRSWLDPESLRSLRFTKRERSPLSGRDENVEIFPDDQRWTAGQDTAVMPTQVPLDGLSFLYFIRTLPLEAGAVYTFDRHFDARRNPVSIAVLARDSVIDDSGLRDVIVVEMRVPDLRQENGQGRIRLHLTDDERRIPLRLETSMPIGGTMVMTLEAHSPAIAQRR